MSSEPSALRHKYSNGRIFGKPDAWCVKKILVRRADAKKDWLWLLSSSLNSGDWVEECQAANFSLLSLAARAVRSAFDQNARLLLGDFQQP